MSRLNLKVRLKRVLNACRWLVIAASNQLPYRLCYRLRQAMLQLAGVKILGRCNIRGPIYIQNPHLLTVGAGTTLNGHIHFENAAPITIGRDCRIGPGCMFFTMVHRGTFPRVDDPQPIVIADRAMLAGAVRILPGVTIGSEAVVAAGSVVSHSVQPGITVASMPARPVKVASDVKSDALAG